MELYLTCVHLLRNAAMSLILWIIDPGQPIVPVDVLQIPDYPKTATRHYQLRLRWRYQHLQASFGIEVDFDEQKSSLGQYHLISKQCSVCAFQYAVAHRHFEYLFQWAVLQGQMWQLQVLSTLVLAWTWSSNPIWPLTLHRFVWSIKQLR